MKSKNQQRYKEEEGTFTSSSSQQAHIFYKHYIPSKGKLPKNIIHVIFQHGMIEHHGRHKELFEKLFEAFDKKIVISVMDLAGHGLSGGDRGDIESFGVFVRDFSHFCEICHERFYIDHKVTTVLGSHSLGGLITLKYVTDAELIKPFQIKGMFLSNPCISPKIELPKGVVNLAGSLPVSLAKVRLPLIYDGHDLTHDDLKVKEFVHDHLISKSISIKLGYETIQATKQISSLSYFMDIPCFFILAEDDRVVDNHKTKLFITGMDKKLVKVKLYPNTRHDILNETCRNEVFKDIINYIEEIRT